MIPSLNGQELYSRAKRVVLGGTGLLSKRPEMYLPDGWPSYYECAKGAQITDIEGKSYLDFTTNGVGTCVLGYSNDEVNEAVIEAYKKGNMTTLNPPEEVQLAERLLELHPWAGMVKFARTGGETCAIAARIARVASGRTKIAVCGYHGWHDWYLALNLSRERGLDNLLLPGLDPTGIPTSLEDSVLPFAYGDISKLEQIFNSVGNDIAAVFMEPARNIYPPRGYLDKIRKLCSQNGALLVFDEITAGFRETTSGIHMSFNCMPDMAIFGKTIANGTPMSAILGTHDVMLAAEKSFISSAFFTERSGPAAALKTIEMHKRLEVGEHVVTIGKRVKSGWTKVFEELKLDGSVAGIPSLANFSFENNQSEKLTFIIQEMLKKGFLVTNQFYPTLSHSEEHVDSYLEAFYEVCTKLEQLIEVDNLNSFLDGPVKHSTFARLL